MKESLKTQAYNIIKEKIISCEYPPNTYLNEEMLREEVHASRTPVRDALGRLEQEGLIRILPKKGIVVSELTIKDINTIYETRLLLEPYVIEQYGYRIGDDVYSRYYKIFCEETEQFESYKMYKIDDEFHDMFIGVSENSCFVTMYEQIRNQTRRMRVLSGKRAMDRLKDTQDEHKKIVSLCLRKEWKQAGENMREHLINAKESYFQMVLQNPNISL